MDNVAGFDFFWLRVDENGDPLEMDALKKRASSASDAIFLAHGFRASEPEARDLYGKFLSSFRSHFLRPDCQILEDFNFVIAGVSWPSSSPPELVVDRTNVTDDEIILRLINKLDALSLLVPSAKPQLDEAKTLLEHLESAIDTQNLFAQLLLTTLTRIPADSIEGLDALRNLDGETIISRLSAPLFIGRNEKGREDLDSEPISEFSTIDLSHITLGSVLDGADHFISLVTWYVLNNRAAMIGSGGLAETVRNLGTSEPGIKIHLVGHGLGGRVIAACCEALTKDPMYQPASVTLLEADFSQFSFSDNNGRGKRGLFRDVIEKKVVLGPLVATHSFQDSLVGNGYALASRLDMDSRSAIGDAFDEFGSIGRNGTINTKESQTMDLKKAGSPYDFQLGIVNNVNGSGGLIKDHGDVTNEDVTYAFAVSIASTEPKTSRVRVFYGTDRIKTGTGNTGVTYGEQRSSSGQISFGECEISVPSVHKVGHLESPSILRLEFRPDPSKHIILSKVDTSEEKVFLERVRSQVDKSTLRDAFIFVHGYNVSFEDAARRTGQMAFDLNFVGAPIFYSWPSNNRMADYIKDETNITWSTPHFQRFLALICQHSSAKRIHVIAHSMGNRAVCEAIKNLSGLPNSGIKLTHLVLAAPDIDADTFKELAETLKALSSTVTLYESSKDKAIQASKRIHGNSRAGEPLLIIPGLETVDASAIDTDFLSHSYFSDNWALLSDIYSILLKDDPPSLRFGLIERKYGEEGNYYAFKS